MDGFGLACCVARLRVVMIPPPVATTVVESMLREWIPEADVATPVVVAVTTPEEVVVNSIAVTLTRGLPTGLRKKLQHSSR